MLESGAMVAALHAKLVSLGMQFDCFNGDGVGSHPPDGSRDEAGVYFIHGVVLLLSRIAILIVSRKRENAGQTSGKIMGWCLLVQASLDRFQLLYMLAFVYGQHIDGLIKLQLAPFFVAQGSFPGLGR